VDHVSFSIAPGEIFGLAGESGCGKSTAAHAIMRLIKPPGRITSGELLFDDRDVLAMTDKQLRDFRWRRVSIVFQSAMNALNPVLSIGTQIGDAIRAHEKMSRGQARDRAAELFELVGIDVSRLDSFPHQLSGGMRQRAVIAMALALSPELIILDEPTTALDVVVQRDILQQIDDLQSKLGFSILFITHDLSLLIEISTRIAVMYAGRIVELATGDDLFRDPLHPYTVGLMGSFPSITGPIQKMEGIPGTPPDLVAPPRGCRFNPRCPHCTPDNQRLYRLQTEVEPGLREVKPGHFVACHLY
jgi:peptide/nickel transport system ATP-binding protein